MGFAGGFTLGMTQAGFELAGKRELPGGFGVANCLANRHLLGQSWNAQVGDPAVWEPTSNTQVVFGNPPCSGFSVMSAKSFRGANSRINECMWHFIRYAARVKPEIVVFESVQPAYNREDGRDLMRRLHTELEERTGYRYGLWHVLHNAYSIGGPAQRRRYFWLASRVPFGIEKPVLRYLPTLDDVIGDLEPLDARTWYPQVYRAPASPYGRQFRSKSGVVDGMATLNDNAQLRRLSDLMEAIPWNPGEHIAIVARRHYERFGRLPPSFASLEAKIIGNDFNMGFTTPTRWHPDRAARVVTGAGLNCTIHPHLNRTITHREAARILGFPDDWNALPLRRVPGVNLTWGKGITVTCGRWIGEWIRRALDGQPGSWNGSDVGDREKVLDVTNTWKTVVIQ